MEKTIHRLYEFLLADPKTDKDYTEGNVVGGYKVYGSALEMKAKFSDIFQKKLISSENSLFGGTPIWHIEDCTVFYNYKNDKEIPGKPLCFGYLNVLGSKNNADKINTLLTHSIPGIGTFVTEYDY